MHCSNFTGDSAGELKGSGWGVLWHWTSPCHRDPNLWDKILGFHKFKWISFWKRQKLICLKLWALQDNKHCPCTFKGALSEGAKSVDQPGQPDVCYLSAFMSITDCFFLFSLEWALESRLEDSERLMRILRSPQLFPVVGQRLWKIAVCFKGHGNGRADSPLWLPFHGSGLSPGKRGDVFPWHKARSTASH